MRIEYEGYSIRVLVPAVSGSVGNGNAPDFNDYQVETWARKGMGRRLTQRLLDLHENQVTVDSNGVVYRTVQYIDDRHPRLEAIPNAQVRYA